MTITSAQSVVSVWYYGVALGIGQVAPQTRDSFIVRALLFLAKLDLRASCHQHSEEIIKHYCFYIKGLFTLIPWTLIMYEGRLSKAILVTFPLATS